MRFGKCWSCNSPLSRPADLPPGARIRRHCRPGHGFCPDLPIDLAILFAGDTLMYLEIPGHDPARGRTGASACIRCASRRSLPGSRCAYRERPSVNRCRGSTGCASGARPRATRPRIRSIRRRRGSRRHGAGGRVVTARWNFLPRRALLSVSITLDTFDVPVSVTGCAGHSAINPFACTARSCPIR